MGKLSFKGLRAKHLTWNSKEDATLTLTQEAEPTSWSIVEGHYTHFLLLLIIFSYYHAEY